MKIAFVIFDGMTALDFVGAYDPVSRLRTMDFVPDLSWDIVARTTPVRDTSGLEVIPTRVGGTLTGYDVLVVPGGLGTRTLMRDAAFTGWLRTGQAIPLKVAVCTGSLLLGAAGFLIGRRATSHPAAYDLLKPLCGSVSTARIVRDRDVITSGGVTAAIDLGLYLCRVFAGDQAAATIRRQMDYVAGEVPVDG